MAARRARATCLRSHSRTQSQQPQRSHNSLPSFSSPPGAAVALRQGRAPLRAGRPTANGRSPPAPSGSAVDAAPGAPTQPQQHRNLPARRHRDTDSPAAYCPGNREKALPPPGEVPPPPGEVPPPFAGPLCSTGGEARLGRGPAQGAGPSGPPSSYLLAPGTVRSCGPLPSGYQNQRGQAPPSRPQDMLQI